MRVGQACTERCESDPVADDAGSIVEKVPIIEIVLVTEVHQTKDHFLSATDPRVEEAVQVGRINAKFAAEPIVVAAALQFHQFHHFLSAQSGLHHSTSISAQPACTIPLGHAWIKHNITCS